jgi:hypothetical protein
MQNKPLLTGVERNILKAMAGFFARQYREATKRNLIDMNSFDWVASQEQADEIYRLTHGQIGLQFSVSGKQAAKKIGVNLGDFVDRPKVILAARQHTYDFAHSCGRSTQRGLANAIATGLEQGEGIGQLQKRVQAVFGIVDPERAENWRAEMIARTESARAISAGSATAWKETGVVSGKEWDASADACPFCEEMHRRVVPLNQPFFTQGQSMTVSWKGKPLTMDFDYLDIDGPPLHPNCRCALLPVVMDVTRKSEESEDEE